MKNVRRIAVCLLCACDECPVVVMACCVVRVRVTCDVSAVFAAYVAYAVWCACVRCVVRGCPIIYVYI
eukprot:9486136-Pyramimonas_sp.AAC.1